MAVTNSIRSSVEFNATRQHAIVADTIHYAQRLSCIACAEIQRPLSRFKQLLGFKEKRIARAMSFHLINTKLTVQRSPHRATPLQPHCMLYKLIFISNSNRLVFHRNFYVLQFIFIFKLCAPPPVNIYNLITSACRYLLCHASNRFKCFSFYSPYTCRHNDIYTTRRLLQPVALSVTSALLSVIQHITAFRCYNRLSSRNFHLHTKNRKS